VFCNDIVRIDVLGPVRRLIFTVLSIDSRGYHQVVAKLILPAEQLATLGGMARGATRQNAARTAELLAVDIRITD
jgi:hypothetical protein